MSTPSQTHIKLRQMSDGTIEVFHNAGQDAYVGAHMVDGRKANAVVPSDVWTKLLPPTP